MFFNRIFSENVKRKMKEKTPRNQGFCDVNRGSGNWTRTSDIRINSPLFYRLNYARITDPILYLKSAQVKDFLNILQGLIFCDFCLLIIRANMSMYDFLQKNIKNNSENIGVNNTVCTCSQTYCFCPNFRHNLGAFYESYI